MSNTAAAPYVSMTTSTFSPTPRWKFFCCAADAMEYARELRNIAGRPKLARRGGRWLLEWADRPPVLYNPPAPPPQPALPYPMWWQNPITSTFQYGAAN